MHESGLCSRACRQESLRETRPCAACHEPFRVYRSWKARFCGETCRQVGKTTLAACRVCGETFRIKPYRLGEAKYCSRACKGHDMDEGRTTADERFRRSAQYKVWRTAVFTRDDFTCQECGTRGGWLEADHIKSFNLFPELRLTPENGRTLCKPCHMLTPTYGGRSRRSVATV